MVRERGPNIPSPAGRKRPRDGNEDLVRPAPAQFQRPATSKDSGYQSKSSSPRRVNFSRQLEQGRTIPNPVRHQSPTRSCLNQRGAQSGNWSPSQQLNEEAANEDEDSDTTEHCSSASSVGHASSATSITHASSANSNKQRNAKRTKPSGPAQGGESYTSTPIALDDEAICESVDTLKARVVEFAEKFPRPVFVKGNEDVLLNKLVRANNAYLVNYVAFLAQGGKRGVQGWAELFADAECHRSLIVGILGRALKEHVFGELYFGATESMIQSLQKQERDLVHQDGFFRTEKRQRLLGKYEDREDSQTFHAAVAKLTIQLGFILTPLWEQGGAKKSTWHTSPMRDELEDIVMMAGNLSRRMRRTGEVVYYWTTTYKDEEFDPARMDCRNLKEMIERSPYQKDTTGDYPHAVLDTKREKESEAVVVVACFPGLTAYRRGGGELAQQTLVNEEKATSAREVNDPHDVKEQYRRSAARERQLTGNEGFRTKSISKSLVHLQWGKQRLLTKEAGTSTHIDAMHGRNGKNMARYDDEVCKGNVELWEVFSDVKAGKIALASEFEKQEAQPSILGKIFG